MEKVLKEALYELIKLHLRIHAGWGGGGGIAQRFKGRKIFRKHSSRQKLFHPFVLKILNRICSLVSLFFFFRISIDIFVDDVLKKKRHKNVRLSRFNHRLLLNYSRDSFLPARERTHAE